MFFEVLWNRGALAKHLKHLTCSASSSESLWIRLTNSASSSAAAAAAAAAAATEASGGLRKVVLFD